MYCHISYNFEGPIGKKGNNGPICDSGQQGPIGIIGPVGPIGSYTGPTGPTGILGLTGNTGPTGPQQIGNPIFSKNYGEFINYNTEQSFPSNFLDEIITIIPISYITNGVQSLYNYFNVNQNGIYSITYHIQLQDEFNETYPNTNIKFALGQLDTNNYIYI